MIETLNTPYTEQEVHDAIKMMIHDGLSANKNTTKTTRTMFGFYSKEEMQKGHGIIMNAEDVLWDNAQNMSHFTCNSYINGGYSKQNPSQVWGHAEGNLAQINVFYIDIDSHETEPQDINVACKDTIGYRPTIIIRTPKGYQLYFVLETPAYVGKEGKVIGVAKLISESLRKKLSENVPGIDFGCNHFGISRFPSAENLVYFQPENVVNFELLKKWSMRVSNDNSKGKKIKTNSFTVNRGNQLRQIDDPWFKELLKCTYIKGGNGKTGRNTAIFTMALACYSSGMAYEKCLSLLTKFNNNLSTSLTTEELNTSVGNAYLGKYKAASKTYILKLSSDWISPNLKAKDLIRPRSWYKVAKKREERKYSHIEEREEDFMNHFLKNGVQKILFEGTKKELCELINIPMTSLERLLQKLQNENKVILETRKGREGGTRIIAATYLILAQLVKNNQEKANTLSTALVHFRAWMKETTALKTDITINQGTLADSS